MRISDWSSDVCSSDLRRLARGPGEEHGAMMPICATRRQMIIRNQKMLAQHALTEAKLVRQLHRAYDFLVAERQLPGLAQRGNFKGVRNCHVKFHEVRLIQMAHRPSGHSHCHPLLAPMGTWLISILYADLPVS